MTTLPRAFIRFRACYRHPAGVVGVGLAASLERLRWIEHIDLPGRSTGGYRLTGDGAVELSRLGVGVQTIPPQMVHKACADYTQWLPDGSRGVAHRRRSGRGAYSVAAGLWVRRTPPRSESTYERRVLALTPGGYTGLLGSRLINRTTCGAFEGTEMRA